ncbi:MAG TPA: hypothetical protein VNO52_05915 [Methylomirabilota bacterium]|nr:hypothetical protein [Methylomirabilota bacterium]
MRFYCLTGLLLLGLAWRLGAQVSVEVVFEEEQFLRDESLRLKVRITNLSGQELQLGEGRDWLTFSVENRDGIAVPRTGTVPVEGAFSLESAMVAHRTVDLMPYFDLSQPGRYLVSATVKIPKWGREFTSRPRGFEIVKGSKIWEQEFGVPGANAEPEVRKYALQLAPFFKERKLYLRLTDAPERLVFRVFPLGPIVSFGRPEAQLDKNSHLHVLFQTGARTFAYTVVTPDGQVALQHTYDYTTSRPTLKSGADGRVLVSGGERRIVPAPAAPSPPPPPEIPESKP